jgi:hypothetical protein
VISKPLGSGRLLTTVQVTSWPLSRFSTFTWVPAGTAGVAHGVLPLRAPAKCR